MRKALPFVLLLVVFGCKARLNVEKDAVLEVGDRKDYTIEAIAKAQTIDVSAKASSGKFNILVVLAKDVAEAEKAMAARKAGDKILAHQFKTDDFNQQVPIPANEAALVMISAADGKKAEVKLKISN